MLYRIAFIVFIVFILSCNFYEKRPLKTKIQIISENIAEDPTNIDLLYVRSDYNKSKNKLESSLYDLKQIVKLDSLNFIHHNNIAKVYFELSKQKNSNPQYPGLVKHHLQKSINIDSKNPEAYALMGELLLAYSKYKEAIELFNSALEIDYNQENTHMLLGYAFKQLNQTNHAINCFRNAININPDFFEAYMQLGHIFHLLEDTIALIYYDNALKLKPTDEMVLYNKALFYQTIGSWNNALDAYTELHKVSPFHSSGHYNLGFIHMELGLYDIASNNFSDAIYSDSEFYEAYYSRGNCFETLGNIQQAESDYRRAIEINSEYTYAIEALKSLIQNNKKYN